MWVIRVRALILSFKRVANSSPHKHRRKATWTESKWEGGCTRATGRGLRTNLLCQHFRLWTPRVQICGKYTSAAWAPTRGTVMLLKALRQAPWRPAFQLLLFLSPRLLISGNGALFSIEGPSPRALLLSWLSVHKISKLSSILYGRPYRLTLAT